MPEGRDTPSAIAKTSWKPAAAAIATVAATASGRRYSTATMKKVRSAKLTAKPTSLHAATDAAKASHAAADRPALRQSIPPPPGFRSALEATRARDSATIAMPYQSGKNPAPGPSGPRYSHCRASRTMYVPSAASASPDQRSAARLMVSPFPVSRLLGGLLVAPRRHDLDDRAARRPELHRDHARIADARTAVGLDLARGPLQVLDFHREVVDARAFARGLRLGGPRAGVVPDEREVDRAVGQVARGVIADLFGLHLGEAEHLAVELGGALEVVDLEREVHDAIHGVLRFQARSHGRSSRTSRTVSRVQTASYSRRARGLPRTGAMRS